MTGSLRLVGLRPTVRSAKARVAAPYRAKPWWGWPARELVGWDRGSFWVIKRGANVGPYVAYVALTRLSHIARIIL